MLASIQYLSKHPDIVIKLQKGEVSLLGVTQTELKAILKTFLSTAASDPADLWK